MRAGLARHTRRQGLSISRRSTHLKSFIYGAVDRAYPPAAKSTVELAIPDGEEWFAWNDEAKHDSIGDSTIPYGLDSATHSNRSAIRRTRNPSTTVPTALPLLWTSFSISSSNDTKLSSLLPGQSISVALGAFPSPAASAFAAVLVLPKSSSSPKISPGWFMLRELELFLLKGCSSLVNEWSKSV